MKKVHVKFTPVSSATAGAPAMSPSMLRTPSPSLSSSSGVVPTGIMAAQSPPFAMSQQQRAAVSAPATKTSIPFVLIMAISAILGILVLVLLRRTRRVERDVAVLQRRTTHMVTGEEIDQAVSYYLQNNMKNVVDQCNAELQPIYTDPVTTLQSDHASLNGTVQSLQNEVQKLTGQLIDLQKILSSERHQHQQQVQQFQQRLDETSKLLTQERDRYIQDVLVLQRSVQNLQQQYNALMVSQQQQMSAVITASPVAVAHQPRSPTHPHYTNESSTPQNLSNKVDATPAVISSLSLSRDQQQRGNISFITDRSDHNRKKNNLPQHMSASLSSGSESGNEEDMAEQMSGSVKNDDTIFALEFFSDNEDEADDDFDRHSSDLMDDSDAIQEVDNLDMNNDKNGDTDENEFLRGPSPQVFTSMIMSMVAKAHQRTTDSSIMGLTEPELMFLPQIIGGRLLNQHHTNTSANSIQIEELSSSEEQGDDSRLAATGEITDDENHHQHTNMVLSSVADVEQPTVSSTTPTVESNTIVLTNSISSQQQPLSPPTPILADITRNDSSTISHQDVPTIVIQPQDNNNSGQEEKQLRPSSTSTSSSSVLVDPPAKTTASPTNDNSVPLECHDDQCPIPPKSSIMNSTPSEEDGDKQKKISSSLANRPRRTTNSNNNNNKQHGKK